MVLKFWRIWLCRATRPVPLGIPKAGIMWAFAKGSQADVCIQVLEKLPPEVLVLLDPLFGAPVDACERLRQVPHGILWFAACGNRNVANRR